MRDADNHLMLNLEWLLSLFKAPDFCTFDWIFLDKFKTVLKIVTTINKPSNFLVIFIICIHSPNKYSLDFYFALSIVLATRNIGTRKIEKVSDVKES